MSIFHAPPVIMSIIDSDLKVFLPAGIIFYVQLDG